MSVVVSDIDRVAVSGASLLRLGRQETLRVQIFDEQQREFAPSIVRLMHLEAHSNLPAALSAGFDHFI